MCVRAITLTREIVVAHQFGAGDEIDAFYIAVLVPNFLINVVGGALGVSIMPAYIDARENEGLEAARTLFSSFNTLGIAGLMAAAIVGATLAPYALPLLGSGFSAQKLELCRRLCFIVAATTVFGGVRVVWAAILNAENRFAAAVGASAITPMVTLVAVGMFAERFRIYSYSVSLVAGSILELAATGVALNRCGIGVMPVRRPRFATLRKVLVQFGYAGAGQTLMASTSAVDQAMAAMLPSGSVALLNYGGRLVQPFVSMGATALNTAVSPVFCRLVSIGDWAGVKRLLRNYTLLTLSVAVPVTLVMVLCSQGLVALVYQHGAFTGAEGRMAGRILACYAFQIPFFIIGTFFVRLIVALQANYLILWVCTLNLVVDIAANVVFMRYLGVAGIALSTSVVYVASCGTVAWLLFRELKARWA